MPDKTRPYLDLAAQLDHGAVSEGDVKDYFAQLPPLDQDLLDHLTAQAAQISLTQPRLGWAIAAVVDAAARGAEETRLKAHAAFHLARAANEWVQPARVAEAVTRARAGFESLNEPGWGAACDWQLYALPWTRNDFLQAVEKLSAALDSLQSAGLTEWVPHCQLSLAYAHLLHGEYEQAQHMISFSSQIFTERNDMLNRARCWLHDASRLRRQGHLNEMLSLLQQALESFSNLGAQVDITKTYYQFAYYYYFQGNYPMAEKHFRLAIEGFATYEMPLWLGQCYNGLGQVFNNMGRPVQALEAFRQADEFYASFDVRGLRADNLLDRARLEMLRADYSKSLESLQRAENDYASLGAVPIAATAALYQGEANLHLSRFQMALYHLERAHMVFQNVDSPWRQAECELYLAQAWSELGNGALAHEGLMQAIERFRQGKQTAYLAQTLNQLALLLLQQGQFAEALPLLEEVLQIASSNRIDIQAAAARQYLGEVYAGMGQYEQALTSLETAASLFEEASLIADQIHCQVSLGYVFAKAGQPANARMAWEKAITLGKETLPGISWQAQAGLAELADQDNDPQTALEWLKNAIASLVVLRQGFWQPALAGVYLERTAPILDRTISVVTRYGTGDDVLDFIEEGKAQTLARHLSTNSFFQEPTDSPALADLRTEINALLTELRVFTEEPVLIQRIKRKDVIAQLHRKHREYEHLHSRQERQAGHQFASRARFELAHFHHLMQARAGQNWAALDYYFTDTHLYGILLSPDLCRTWQFALTQHQKLILKTTSRVQGENETLASSDLEILGNLLLPPGLDTLLTPDTLLVIAPHRGLHKIPWAAIPLFSGGNSQPLVTACIPLVAPALHTLAILWGRHAKEVKNTPRGLAMAVSDFGERYRSLPFVPRELQQIKGLFGDERLNILEETEATRELLRDFVQKTPLQTLDFLHLATHAFYDPLTGRTSGIALYDQDLWLDQLWEIAPLPPLVTLSACYGIQSRVYEGDEHIGLAATCLAAGANHVVGSLWPVLDETAADLMVAFYRHYLKGKGIAHSLAEAQRAAMAISQPGWQSFSCYGLP